MLVMSDAQRRHPEKYHGNRRVLHLPFDRIRDGLIALRHRLRLPEDQRHLTSILHLNYATVHPCCSHAAFTLHKDLAAISFPKVPRVRRSNVAGLTWTPARKARALCAACRVHSVSEELYRGLSKPTTPALTAPEFRLFKIEEIQRE